MSNLPSIHTAARAAHCALDELGDILAFLSRVVVTGEEAGGTPSGEATSGHSAVLRDACRRVAEVQEGLDRICQLAREEIAAPGGAA